ncbi:MAG: hypothetical protein HY717_13070 [Planctomycetes bacterium]|nr:hypothetical protein [Planctomycetota bacterium]
MTLKNRQPRLAVEQVVIREDSVELHLPGSAVQTLPASALIEAVQAYSIRGLGRDALPDNIKWKVECGKMTIYIVELKPEVRSVLWISSNSVAPYGPEAKYESYRLAFPFVVLKVPFVNGQLIEAAELFYRNAPLSSLDDELFWSNLLNVSPRSHGCTAWVCTQYLADEMNQLAAKLRRPLTEVEALHCFILHLFGGGLNRSSEAHEGMSCFGKAAMDKVDPRVTDVTRWQAASEKPEFILGVAWKPAGHTIRSLILDQLDRSGARRDLGDAAELVSLLLAPRKAG